MAEWVQLMIEELRGPARVKRVRGEVRRESDRARVQVGDMVSPGMVLCLDPGASMVCEDDGNLTTYQAGKKLETISFVLGAQEPEPEPEALADTLTVSLEGYRRLVELESQDPVAGALAISAMTEHVSYRQLRSQFDMLAAELLPPAERHRFRVVPIRLSLNDTALIVASDAWTAAKALFVIERTKRLLNLVVLKPTEIDTLLRRAQRNAV